MSRLRGDRGVVAALVAVLLSGGVLLGVAALVVDVGLLYVEREQLQSGADAGSLAVAAVCAERPAKCTQSTMDYLAEAGYADKNSSDGLSGAKVCGRNLPHLDTCDPGVGNLTDCLPLPPSAPPGAPYVEVRTTTQVAGGKFVLPSAFAGAVTGYSGATVRACSRVSWGPVKQTTLDIAMAVSLCDFNQATDNGTRYQPPPSKTANDPDLDPTKQAAMSWRPPDAPRSCAGGPIPRGFGFLSGAGSDCRLDVSVGQWYEGTTTPGSPPGCGNAIEDAHDNFTPVAVAVFDQTDKSDPPTYHVAGIAIFVITGWQEVSWDDPDYDHAPDPAPESPAKLCPSGVTTAELCVYGYFTTRVFRTGTGDLGADNFGSVYIRTIG